METTIGSVAVLIVLVSLAQCAEWNYDTTNTKKGPYGWGTTFSQFCNASENHRQSPIDILLGSLVHDTTLTPLMHTNFEAKDVTFSVLNNGHTIQCSVIDGRMMTEGGPLAAPYQAVQFHLHWGSKGVGGSEHTVLGKHHQAEMHIVHINYNYIKLPISEVLKRDDGLAAVGIFIDIAEDGETPNAEFSKVVAAAKKRVLSKADTTMNLTRGELNLDNLLPSKRDGYYTYPGGLTTPACNGVVTWLIYKEPIRVRKDDLEALFMTMDEEDKPVVENFRPVQPVGTRRIRTNTPDRVVSGSRGLHSAVQSGALLFLALFLTVLFY